MARKTENEKANEVLQNAGPGTLAELPDGVTDVASPDQKQLAAEGEGKGNDGAGLLPGEIEALPPQSSLLKQFNDTLAQIGLKKSAQYLESHVSLNDQEIKTLDAFRNLAATLYAIQGVK